MLKPLESYAKYIKKFLGIVMSALDQAIEDLNQATVTLDQSAAIMTQSAENIESITQDIGSLVNDLQGTVAGINNLLITIFRYINPGTSKEAIEHFTQIIKAIVYVVTVFVSGILSFSVSGALKVFLPMTRTFSFVIYISSLVGVFVALFLLAHLYLIRTLESSGNELAQAIINTNTSGFESAM